MPVKHCYLNIVMERQKGRNEVAHLAADLKTDRHEGKSPRVGGGQLSHCDDANHRCCDDDCHLLHFQSGRSSCCT